MKNFFKLLAKGLVLLAPVIGFMVYTNYTVDPTGMFHGEQFAREAVEYMLAGTPISNYDALENKTRTINEAIILNSPAYDTLVIGSSRAMLISAQAAGTTGTFFNMGVVGGDFQDLYGSFYLCDREDKLPSTVIIGMDTWMLNYGETDFRSIPEWYSTFVQETLGFDLDYTPEATVSKWQALFDPAYFQGAIAYQNRDQSEEAKPEPVAEEDLYEQTTTVKMPDGTIIYDKKFRTLSQGDVDFLAQRAAENFDILAFRLDGWDGPSAQAKAEFEAYIDHMTGLGIRVVLVLTPYHPFVYDALMEHADELPGVAAMEEYLTTLAKKKGIELYGSYSPYECGLENSAFYDHFHMREGAVAALLAPMREQVFE